MIETDRTTEDQPKKGKLLHFEDVDWRAMNKEIHESMEIALNGSSILAKHIDRLRRLTH